MATKFERISTKVKSVIKYIFPILKIENFPQLVTRDLILSKNRNLKTFISNSVVLFMIFLVILTAFQIPFLQDLHSLTTPILGPTGRMIYILEAFALIELVLIRFWIFFALNTRDSSIDIEYVKLILQTREPVQRKILLWLKVLLFQAQFCVYPCSLLIHIVEYIHSNHPMKLGRLILWSFGFCHLMRVGIHHTFILIAFTFAGLSVLVDGINEMKSLLETSLTNISSSELINVYLHYIKCVQRMSSLTKYILFTGNLFNIPFMSLVLFFISVPTNGIVKILKYSIIFTIIFYSCRVYILTWILSRVDKESKQIYSKINSAIARGKVTNYYHAKLLLNILEDFSCSINHFVIKEYNSTVTQMDTFNSIANTLSIVSLFFSSDELVEKLLTFS